MILPPLVFPGGTLCNISKCLMIRILFFSISRIHSTPGCPSSTSRRGRTRTKRQASPDRGTSRCQRPKSCLIRHRQTKLDRSPIFVSEAKSLRKWSFPSNSSILDSPMNIRLGRKCFTGYEHSC